MQVQEQAVSKRHDARAGRVSSRTGLAVGLRGRSACEKIRSHFDFDTFSHPKRTTIETAQADTRPMGSAISVLLRSRNSSGAYITVLYFSHTHFCDRTHRPHEGSSEDITVPRGSIVIVNTGIQRPIAKVQRVPAGLAPHTHRTGQRGRLSPGALQACKSLQAAAPSSCAGAHRGWRHPRRQRPGALHISDHAAVYDNDDVLLLSF